MPYSESMTENKWGGGEGLRKFSGCELHCNDSFACLSCKGHPHQAVDTDTEVADQTLGDNDCVACFSHCISTSGDTEAAVMIVFQPYPRQVILRLL